MDANPDKAASTPKTLRMGLGLLAVLLLAWGAVGWVQPSADDWAARGWAAYNAGSYRAARAALSEARTADPEIEGLATLERAIAVGAILDETEALITAGQLAGAKARLAVAVAQAPQDQRTRAMHQALQTAHAAAAGARNTEMRRRRPRSTPQVEATTRAQAHLLHGTVRVLSNQPALMVVDGILMPGVAPKTLRLPVGDHAIELREPGTDRVLARRDVRIRARRDDVVHMNPAQWP